MYDLQSLNCMYLLAMSNGVHAPLSSSWYAHKKATIPTQPFVLSALVWDRKPPPTSCCVICFDSLTRGCLHTWEISFLCSLPGQRIVIDFGFCPDLEFPAACFAFLSSLCGNRDARHSLTIAYLNKLRNYSSVKWYIIFNMFSYSVVSYVRSTRIS